MPIGSGLALLAGSAISAGVSANAAKKTAAATGKAADQATALQRDIYDRTTENYAPYLAGGNDAMAAYLFEMGLGPRPMMGGTTPTIETITSPMQSVGGVDGLSSFGGLSNGSGQRGGMTQYKVGGQTFSTLKEAEDWAAKNKTGGTEYGGYSTSPMAKYLLEQGVDSVQGSAAAQGGLYSGATLEALEGNRRTVIGADTADYFSKLFGTANMGMAAAGNQAGAGSAYANNVGSLAMGAAQAKGQGYMGAANAISTGIGDMAGIYGYMQNPMAAYAAPTMGGGGR
jgi:hypothetical protein